MAKQVEKAVRFRLNHVCNIRECFGGPGDVVETRQSIADFLIAHGGGEIVKETQLQTQETK